jgi:membrane protease YdiL (CAAX protease family)
MTILAAAGTAVIVLLAGNLPWAGFGPIGGLARGNLRVGTAFPWAVLPMALYLWAYWRVIGGRWNSGSNAADRRLNLRANPLSIRLWCASVAAGMLGFGALLALLAIAARVVQLPAGQPITFPSEMPFFTAFLLLVMQSLVAGVSEESAFRGYMQSMIAREHGLLVAILANGTLFGLLHFGSHPGDVLLMLPYYVAVSAVYGGLTWAADSILPALVLHSVGDIVVLTRWSLTGRPEWQLGATVPPLVWERGIDATFVLIVIAFILLAALTARSYLAVCRLRIAGAPTSLTSGSTSAPTHVT